MKACLSASPSSGLASPRRARLGIGGSDDGKFVPAADAKPSCQRQGRKERCLPLWKETARDMRAWLAVRGNPSTPELFVNAQGDAMTRAGFENILAKHGAAAARISPTLAGRTLTLHLLRHSCAVLMLQATHDIRKVALWLGHADIRTTEVYLRMDPSEKLEAVEAVLPPALRRGRFKAPDALIAALLDDSRRLPGSAKIERVTG